MTNVKIYGVPYEGPVVLLATHNEVFRSGARAIWEDVLKHVPQYLHGKSVQLTAWAQQHHPDLPRYLRFALLTTIHGAVIERRHAHEAADLFAELEKEHPALIFGNIAATLGFHRFNPNYTGFGIEWGLCDPDTWQGAVDDLPWDVFETLNTIERDVELAYQND